MRELTLEEVKKLQVGVLQAIHEFCQEKGIIYSLACGTMLGCARHKGYIPWDDDIDIYLLRNDYDQLITQFPPIYKNRYELFSLERKSNWNKAYAKAFDSKTIFIENGDADNSIGINIDIFPIDNVPDDVSEWGKYNKRRRVYQHLYELKIVKLNKKRSLWKNLVIIGSKILLSPFSSRRIAIFLDRYAQMFRNIESASVFECAQGLFQKNPFPRELFSETVPLPFEGCNFMCFKDYDTYLSKGFGNWRQLPPKEKQVSHHSFKAYWKE